MMISSWSSNACSLFLSNTDSKISSKEKSMGPYVAKNVDEKVDEKVSGYTGI